MAVETFKAASFADYKQAAQNYLYGMNLPAQSRPDFLIVTDQSDIYKGRSILSRAIFDLARHRKYGDAVTRLGFNDAAQELQIKAEVKAIMARSKSIATILLSGSQPWRFGVYDAVKPDMRPKGRVLRFGYSPGMTAADIAILAQINPVKLEDIRRRVKKRYDWFVGNQSGTIVMCSGKDMEHTLHIPFDATQAPPVPSSGFLTRNNRKGNIPSGETHIVPFPQWKSHGTVAAEGGIVLTVRNGIATHVDVDDNAVQTAEERALIEKLRTRKPGQKGIPLSELGGGALAGANIIPYEHPTHPDGRLSILTREKLGWHLGFGVPVGPSPETAAIKRRIQGAQSHTDVLVENANVFFEGNQVNFA